jgi:hypothetical protein
MCLHLWSKCVAAAVPAPAAVAAAGPADRSSRRCCSSLASFVRRQVLPPLWGGTGTGTRTGTTCAVHVPPDTVELVHQVSHVYCQEHIWPQDQLGLQLLQARPSSNVPSPAAAATAVPDPAAMAMAVPERMEGASPTGPASGEAKPGAEASNPRLDPHLPTRRILVPGVWEISEPRMVEGRHGRRGQI